MTRAAWSPLLIVLMLGASPTDAFAQSPPASQLSVASLPYKRHSASPATARMRIRSGSRS